MYINIFNYKKSSLKLILKELHFAVHKEAQKVMIGINKSVHLTEKLVDIFFSSQKLLQNTTALYTYQYMYLYAIIMYYTKAIEQLHITSYLTARHCKCRDQGKIFKVVYPRIFSDVLQQFKGTTLTGYMVLCSYPRKELIDFTEFSQLKSVK